MEIPVGIAPTWPDLQSDLARCARDLMSPAREPRAGAAQYRSAKMPACLARFVWCPGWESNPQTPASETGDFTILPTGAGQGGRVRTSGLRIPSAALYRAELHPENLIDLLHHAFGQKRKRAPGGALFRLTEMVRLSAVHDQDQEPSRCASPSGRQHGRQFRGSMWLRFNIGLFLFGARWITESPMPVNRLSNDR